MSSSIKTLIDSNLRDGLPLEEAITRAYTDLTMADEAAEKACEEEVCACGTESPKGFFATSGLDLELTPLGVAAIERIRNCVADPAKRRAAYAVIASDAPFPTEISDEDVHATLSDAAGIGATQVVTFELGAR